MLPSHSIVDPRSTTYPRSPSGVLYMAEDGVAHCPGIAYLPSVFPALDISAPCDRLRILERFTSMVCTSPMLAPEADRILHDIHIFVGAHSNGDPLTTGPGSSCVLPGLLEDHSAEVCYFLRRYISELPIFMPRTPTAREQNLRRSKARHAFSPTVAYYSKITPLRASRTIP